MDAIYPPSESAIAESREKLNQLLYLDEFQPPLDLRDGSYNSPSSGLRLRVAPDKTASLASGLAMFWHYMKVVRRDRAKALRGEYSDFWWGRSGLELTRLFETYGARFRISGLEQLAQCKEPVVFASNHMSTLETQTFSGHITPYMPTTFVVKSSLTRGYFAPLICSRPYIALERKNPLKDLETVLEEGQQVLQGGRSVILFPQSTREENCFSRSRFNSIAVRLAAKAGVLVVPIALSTSFWSQSKTKAIQYIPLLHPERDVHIVFGPPMAVEGRGKKTQEQVVDFICEHMTQWGVPVLA